MGITATSRSGRTGIPITRGALHVLLRNPIYRGLVPHKGKCYPGQHEGIIDEGLWDAVRQKLTAGVTGEGRVNRKTDRSPLMGKLFDELGRPLMPSHSTTRGRRYRYYQTHEDDRDQDVLEKAQPRGWRLPAKQIEKCVGEIVSTLLLDRSRIGAAAIVAGLTVEEIDSLLGNKSWPRLTRQ